MTSSFISQLNALDRQLEETKMAYQKALQVETADIDLKQLYQKLQQLEMKKEQCINEAKAAGEYK
jgi:hypothetical protein